MADGVTGLVLVGQVGAKIVRRLVAWIIAELMRMIVMVAVSCNDVIKAGANAYEFFRRYVFEECDEIAGYFPWPPE